MKNAIFIGVLLAVGAGGYWLGTRTQPVAASTVKADNSNKILYYRNPMGLPDTSPVPKKDAMGMDYVPVFESGQGESGQLTISLEKVQKLGVKSEKVALRVLNKTLRASGRIEIDERRSYTIAPKFEGWVEKLYVNTTGEQVVKGQPLFDVYSPELISAQREYALASQGVAALGDADQDAKKSMKQLAEASRMRLKNWGMDDAQIGATEKQSITFLAPVTGIVLEKKAVQGMRFMPGEVLYQIADLSSVWVVAEVAEQDIASVRLGSIAQVKVDAYPQNDFKGKISFIYPTLDTATRTVKVRMEVANPRGLLKPAMFANVEIMDTHEAMVLTVPSTAVIDSGTRKLVLVQLAQGNFEPRTVRVGRRGDQYVEVLEGITEGELVVTSANFLIDSESNLKAALGGMSTNPAPVIEAAATEEHAVHAVMPKKKSAKVGHQVQGTLDGINADGTLSISHQPIEALGWPAMTMDFDLANSSLADGISPGSPISFEIVERKSGEWVITKLQAVKHEGH